MTTTTETIDLAPFCAKKDTNYSVSTPYVVAGWRYACNQHVAVRIPAAGESDTTFAPAVQIPDFGKLFAPLARESCVHPWTDAKVTRQIGDCWACDGRGCSDPVECDTCKGTGWSECEHCGHDGECQECDGEGYFKGNTRCPECKGNKKLMRIERRLIGPSRIRGDNDMLIRALPNVRYQMPTDAEAPVLFTFDGGEGVVMPLFNPSDAA